MGVPGLRLCSDIVADGLEQLHPRSKITSTSTHPLVICAGAVGVWDWARVVCALRGGCGCECERERVCVMCYYVRCSEVRGCDGNLDPVDEGASLEKTRNT